MLNLTSREVNSMSKCLRKLEDKIKNCEKCFSKPKQVLLGRGSENAEVMIVSTVLSTDSEKEKALLLQKKYRAIFDTILRILGIDAKQIWITSAVKCIKFDRELGVMSYCSNFLKEEIECIKPKLIIFLGEEIAEMHNEKCPSLILGQTTIIYFWHPMYCIKNPQQQFRYFDTLLRYVDKWKAYKNSVWNKYIKG